MPYKDLAMRSANKRKYEDKRRDERRRKASAMKHSEGRLLYEGDTDRQRRAREMQQITMKSRKEAEMVLSRFKPEKFVIPSKMIIIRNCCERCEIRFTGEPCPMLTKADGTVIMACSICHAELPCPCRAGRVIDLIGPPVKEVSPLDSLDTGSASRNTRGTGKRPTEIMFAAGEMWR